MLSELKRIVNDIDTIISYMDNSSIDLYGHKIENGEFINQYLGDILDNIRRELSEVVHELEDIPRILGDGNRY